MRPCESGGSALFFEEFKMKMKKLVIISCALFFGIAGPAGATLFDRGGGLIYDDVLDITWLQKDMWYFFSQ